MNPKNCPSVERVHGQRVRCYDNLGKTLDRYTVVYLDQPEHEPRLLNAVGMDHRPFQPGGIGMHVAAMCGKHLGKRIPFANLPEPCQRLVNQDLKP